MSKTILPKEVVPKQFKEMIISELILPSYRENIQYTIRTRTCWSVVCTICLTSSTILIGLSSLLSFSSSSFPDANMGFYAGSVGIIAVLLKEFSSYANSQDHLKTVEMNEILKNIGIDFKFEDTSGLELGLINRLDQSKTNITQSSNGLLSNGQTVETKVVDSNEKILIVSNPMIQINDLSQNNIDINRTDASSNFTPLSTIV
jgi:hypothetical protein